MLTLGPLNHDALRRVVNRLWLRGRIEALEFGVSSVDVLLDALAVNVGSRYSFCVSADDDPVIAFGATEVEPEQFTSWFIATDGFENVGIQATRLVRSFLKARRAERPNATLRMTSKAPHPSAERWFRLIGFEPLGKGEYVLRK
jgi:hypothetical protein